MICHNVRNKQHLPLWQKWRKSEFKSSEQTSLNQNQTKTEKYKQLLHSEMAVEWGHCQSTLF